MVIMHIKSLKFKDLYNKEKLNNHLIVNVMEQVIIDQNERWELRLM